MTRPFQVSGSLVVIILMIWSLEFPADASSPLVIWGSPPDDTPASLGELRAISAGSIHCVALDFNGVVTAWGANWSGQIDVPPNLGPVMAVSAGDSHTLALRPNGTVAAWGDNNYLQCQIPAGLWNVAAVAAGGLNSTALKRDGTVVAWGYEDYGQTQLPPDLMNIVAVSVGGTHALALKADGTVVAWGANDQRQTEVPVHLTNAVAIAAGLQHSLALTAEGTVVAWGDNSGNQTNVPAGLSEVVSIDAGDFFSLALKADGTVFAWGSGSSMETNVPPGLSNVVAIAAGGTYSMALLAGTAPSITSPLLDRTVAQGFPVYFRTTAVGAWPLSFQWKLNGVEVPDATNSVFVLNDATPEDQGWYSVVVSNAFGVVESESALLQVVPLFVRSNPRSQAGYWGNSVTFSVEVNSVSPVTYQWLFNGIELSGETNQTLVLMDLQPDDAGFYGVVVSNPEGSVRSTDAELTISQIAAWGFNPFSPTTNVPPNLINVVSIASGFQHCLAVRADGSVSEWGDVANWPTQVPADLYDAVSVAAGGSHSLAVRRSGSVVGWGENTYGQLNIPAGLSDAVAVAAGVRHSLALRADGTVAAWGDNSSRQTNVPPNLSSIVGIAAGSWHNLALRSDGSVIAWGGSAYHTNIPPDLTNAVAVAAGSYHNLALTADGRVVAWGAAGAQANVPPGLSNVIAIAAGYVHSVALTAHGTLAVWGDSWALVNPPVGLSGFVALTAGENTSMALIGVGPPVLTLAVTNVTGVYGRSVYLRAEATGTLPMSYQWRFNGVDIPGATDPVLQLHDLEFEQAGLYTVVVSNAHGVATNSPLSLSVLPLEVTSQPRSQTVLPNATARFDVGVLGQPPFWYQWQFNGANLPNATNSSFVLTNVQLNDAGLYSVVVSNAVGYTRSADAMLSVSGVVVWGTNNYGQLNVPGNLLDVVALASGQNHIVALRSDGTVAAWGDNRFGQTNVPAGLSDVVSIAAGPGNHTLALKSDGAVVAWGLNTFGQTNVPPGVQNIVAIAAGESHSLALRADGAVLAWGRNHMGQTNVPAGLTSVVALAGLSTSSAALRANGTVVFWGTNTVVFPPSGSQVPLTNIVSIAGGSSHLIGLRANGTVVSSGGGRFGDPTPVGLSNVVAVSAGVNQSLALKREGTIATWSGSPMLQVPAALTNMAMIAGGLNHSAAATAAGPPFLTAGLPDRVLLMGSTDYFWISATGARPLTYQWRSNGTNIIGATQAVFTVSNVQSNRAGVYSVIVSNALGVTTSREFTVSLAPLWITNQPKSVVTFQGGSASFSVGVAGPQPFRYQWQFNGSDLPGRTNSFLLLTNVQISQSGEYVVRVANSYGEALSTAANLSVNRVVAWGNNSEGLTNVPPGLSNAVAISAGNGGCTALKADGTVQAWGLSGMRNVPAGLSNVVAISSASDYALALKSDGTVVSWGNGYGVPAGLGNIVAISANGYFNVVLLADGTVRAWGDSYSGETNVPPGLTNVVSVASLGHTLALLDNGTVVAWGPNDFGETDVPGDLTNVVSVKAGYSVSLALRDDGTVVAWGDNSYGLTDVPQGLTGVVGIETGGYTVLALRADGTVTAWGAGTATNGPLGLSNVVDVVAASTCVALKQDGTIITWGATLPGQAIASMLRNVVAADYSGGAIVALLGDGPLEVSRPVADPFWHPAEFGFSFPTERGKVYLVEFKDALTDQTWGAFPLVRGNGQVHTWSDKSALGTNRFYRVRCW
ncbi:MAG: immunoglobulin domain-containing protein [Verrucomicrobia bacterium]|nr:immunoglobulin domain-containing protein [Verrucomicrobiota bacterium]